MNLIKIKGGGRLRGTLRVPGDKSISHRSLIFNAFSVGEATISGLLGSQDVKATAACLRSLGVDIVDGRVRGCGGTFTAPQTKLDCGNSGTTFRLMLGLVAGQSFEATFSGDESLSKRPMARVIRPLKAMGARFTSEREYPPISIQGGLITNGKVDSSVASAQVKTAVMLAALQGTGTLTFTEPALSRDHTERMLKAMGVKFEDQVLPDGRHTIRLKGPQKLHAVDFVVPGDISSAAFFMVAGLIVPDSEIFIENVGINPSRSGVLDVLRAMGGDIEEVNSRTVGGEPVADLRVRSSVLSGVGISGDLIPRLIDEIPVLAVAMAHATGKSTVREASELRVKESDRIKTTLGILNQLGVHTVEVEDGFDVMGHTGAPLRSLQIDADNDHRIAMSALVAAVSAEGESTVEGAGAIATSFPGFYSILEGLRD